MDITTNLKQAKNVSYWAIIKSLWKTYCDRRVNTLNIAFFNQNLPCFGTQGFDFWFFNDITPSELFDLSIQITKVWHIYVVCFLVNEREIKNNDLEYVQQPTGDVIHIDLVNVETDITQNENKIKALPLCVNEMWVVMAKNEFVTG